MALEYTCIPALVQEEHCRAYTCAFYRAIELIRSALALSTSSSISMTSTAQGTGVSLRAFPSCFVVVVSLRVYMYVYYTTHVIREEEVFV